MIPSQKELRQDNKSAGRPSSFAALFSGWQRAWMPLVILGMRIAEPFSTRVAMHRRRVIARLVVGRHSLTQALVVLFSFFHYRTPAAPFYLFMDGKTLLVSSEKGRAADFKTLCWCERSNSWIVESTRPRRGHEQSSSVEALDEISWLTLADDFRRSSPDARLKPVKNQRKNEEGDCISFFLVGAVAQLTDTRKAAPPFL
jgi:hypothetical protein